MRVYILLIVIFVSVSFAIQSCKPTETEKVRATEITKRRRLVESGEIEKEIGEETYTSKDLEADMMKWWVNAGLLDQSNSIQKITSLLGDSEQRPPTSALLLPHLLEWISPIITAASAPGFEDISEAIAEVSTFALSLSNTAKVSVAQNEDYFNAIGAFRKALPLEAVEKYPLVEEFTKYLTGNATRLLAGYRFLTLIMNHMPSYRQNINGYVSNFLKGTFRDRPAEGDVRSSVVLKLNVPTKPLSKVVFPMTPGHIDACDFIKELWEINEECIDRTHLQLKWLITAHDKQADVFYACSDLGKPVVCCGFFCEQCDNPPEWPTNTMKEECNSVITDLSLIQGQVYGSGIESCFTRR